MKKVLMLFAFLSLLSMQIFAQRTVTGMVTSAADGQGLPGVAVAVKGTSLGTVTDINGKYTLNVPEEAKTLVFSFMGYKTKEVAITGDVVNAVMEETDIALDDVVVTALGITREKKTLAYGAQDVKAEELTMTQDANIKSAIAGKVAGVQIKTQAGSKLGESGKIRIRGAISMTADSDPLYVIDGIPTTDPNIVDMENVASVNVLKGPAATALYGQRAEFGVVIITTKQTQKTFSVEFNSNLTFDKVSYLPNYQNLYGGGYEGEASFGTFDYNDWLNPFYEPAWEALDGQRHLVWDNNYADESWGPKFDGEPYVPWYAWWPGNDDFKNPYYGQTVPYSAQPDNIKDFYDLGTNWKNTISVGGSNEWYNARFSYTNISQNGIMPNSSLDKNMFNLNLNFKLSEKINVGLNTNYSTQDVAGDFDDDYGNQTTGSFSSWFNRNIEIDKMSELRNLQTPDGYHASWNWWGPEYYAYVGNYLGREGFKKPAFWYNPYYWLDNYVNKSTTDNLIAMAFVNYQINDKFAVKVSASTNTKDYSWREELPSSISRSAAPELYNSWINGFGIENKKWTENNYYGRISYKDNFGDFDIDAFVEGQIRDNYYSRVTTKMDIGGKTGGLILPDVYLFSNASILPATDTYYSEKQVLSLYGAVSMGYKNMLYVDVKYRNDWSSALPADNNSYGYPSVGASFIFTELMDNNSILSFGKVRATWAQVGNDLSAYLLDPVYPTGDNPYEMANGDLIAQMYTNRQKVDPELKPALNTGFDLGFDLKFFQNRLGVDFTYYNEVRTDEIIPISLSRTTGYETSLINAGESKRTGVELVLTGTPVKMSNGFTWDVLVNWAVNNTTIEELPEGMDAISAPGGTVAFGFVSMYHYLGDAWGQLRGTGIAKDDNGNYIINPNNGTYVTEPGQYLGSVLPDFTGGIINTFSYKGVSLGISMDFQKGGNFFSLTEMWGSYSGLLEETAAINDKGNNVRDDVADGGGVHVVGVDTEGNPVDMYADAHTYFAQWYSNKLAEPFVHDASYLKLREVSLTYRFPEKWFANNFISSASLGFVGRNLWLIAVSDDNVHKWDPSELSQTYGENAQLPGTRSYGFNLKLTF